MSFLFKLRSGAHSAVRGCIPHLMFTVLAGALHPSASAGAPLLTLEAAQQRAVHASRKLAAKDHAAAALGEMAISARELPDPVLSVGIDSLPLNGAERYSLGRDSMTQRRIGLMQEFTRSEKRRLRAERFEREAARSMEEKQVGIAEVRRETAIAWFERYYTEAMATLVSEQVNEAQRQIVSAQALYRGGRGSQSDVLAARVALAAAKDRADELQRRVDSARLMLARWTGAAADTELAGKPDIDTVPLDPASIDTLLVQHPQNRALMREQEVAATEASLARAERSADWSVEVAYQKRGAAYSDMVSVAVSVPLQWKRRNRQDRELASKLATVEEIKAEREEVLRSDIAQGRVMSNEWDANRARIQRYTGEIIPLAQARIEASLAAYRGGKASLSDVLAARRDEIDARLQALQLEADTARLWAQLQYLFPRNHIAVPAVQRSEAGK